VSNKAITVLAALLVAVGAAAWYWAVRVAPAPATTEARATPAVAVPQPPAPAASSTGGASLPSLANSDTPFNAALLALPGAQALANLVRPENMIRHLVATVDNLPRHKLAVELRPLETTSGTLLVVGGDLQATMDEHNATRYAPAMAVLQDLDMHALNSLYRHYYPLFQRAYEDLGYPQKSFNDRLLATIDDLLQTPHPPRPLALVRPKVFWEFADPNLEARSAGQKLLLRLGPDNQAVVERKLRELRGLIAARGTAAAKATP
jgi:hypothetical protein